MAGRAITDRDALAKAMAEAVPDGVTSVMGAVSEAGGSAWLVGGCVRDVALGLEPRDWNVVCDLPPDKVAAVLADGDACDDGPRMDVSALRGDGATGIDGLLDDLSWRDFTVNSIAWSPDGRIIDLEGGLADLSAGILRCSGSAHARLDRDPVRILRALRLHVTHGLIIDGTLASAIHTMRGTLRRRDVARERVMSEFARLIAADDAGMLRRVLLDYRDVVFEVIPELRDGDGMEQVSPWHCLTVYEHAVEVTFGVAADEATRLAALLHDVAKPSCMVVDDDGTMHFPGHAEAGEAMAASVLRRLRFDEGTVSSVRRLVRHHDDRPGTDRRSVASIMRGMGGKEAFDRWRDLQRADVMAQSQYAKTVSLPKMSRMCAVADEMADEGCPTDVRGLCVSGDDLTGLGVPQGPEVSAMLGGLLDSVMAGEVPNDRSILEEEARRRLAESGRTAGGNRPLRGISLYTGAGGADIGFERAGIEVVWANELVPDFAATYSANHDDGVMHVGDIDEQMATLDDLEGLGDIDIVFGGPPCQGFSVAGKMDPDDPRSRLIFTFLDVVEKVRPRCFVMENVKALGEMRRWERVRAKYMQRAADLGYMCRRFTLSAADYGVPQKRERTFFVGIRDDIRGGVDFEEAMRSLLDAERRESRTVREAISDLGPAGTDDNPDTCPARITFAKHPIMRSTPYAGMYFNGQGRPVDLDGQANTLPASMGGNRTPIIDEWWLSGRAKGDWVAGYRAGLAAGKSPKSGIAPRRLRRMTIREAMRIQTFPDDYEFVGSPSSIYSQIGNAVPCDLAEAVAKAVVACLGDLEQGTLPQGDGQDGRA